MRHNGFAQLIIEWTVEGKRVRGRPKYTYIEQVVKDVGTNGYRKVKAQLVQDLPRWRVKILDSELKEELFYAFNKKIIKMLK